MGEKRTKREACRYCGGGSVDLLTHEENCVSRPADPPAGYRFDAFADVRMGRSLFAMRNEDWLIKDRSNDR